MTDEEFGSLVAAGIDALPEHVLLKMHNVAIVVADTPTEEQRMSHYVNDSETLFGLYEGVPQTERGAGYSALPDVITVFKKPILATYTDLEDIKTCIANTVWHEVAHHFGMDEEEVEVEEIKRGRLL